MAKRRFAMVVEDEELQVLVRCDQDDDEGMSPLLFEIRVDGGYLTTKMGFSSEADRDLAFNDLTTDRALGVGHAMLQKFGGVFKSLADDEGGAAE